MKKLLIDLSALENTFEGYGQIAFNYGKHFERTYCRQTTDYELTLLVPQKYVGAFGSEVRYLNSSNWWRRHSCYLFPKFDIWHDIWQSSRFKPCSPKTKYIYTVHDLNCLVPDYEGSEKRIKKYTRRIGRKINRAEIVVAISEFTKKQIQQFYGSRPNRLKVIYNGVERLIDQPQSKPETVVEMPFFFSISAFRPKKNFHLLLDMMKLMPEKQLYLAGDHDTEYGLMIKQRIQDERIDNVKLLGKVSEAEKRWFYAHCEAFFFPSSFEGFGLPIIEAMQFGKPVFSSKETSLCEMGSLYAYFWDVLEPKAMQEVVVEKLQNFYDNSQLAESEKHYALSFSYEKHFAEYEKIYRSLTVQQP